MKVLVLGGTGVMGQHLVERLSAQMIQTVVTSRKPFVDRGSVRYIQGNAHDTTFLDTLLPEKWDVIVDFMAYKTSEFEKCLAGFLQSTSQYIYLSSARVYSNSDHPITEETPRLLDASLDDVYLKTDEYALAKARQENLLTDSGSTNWTIIRPYITYSAYRLQLGVLEKEEWLYRALQHRTIVFTHDISERYTTMTYGDDVAGAIVSLMGIKEAMGQAFHITSQETITWREVLTIYLDVLETHLGMKVRVLFQDIDAFLQSKPAKYQVRYDRLFNRSFDNSKISRHVDISQFRRVSTGLKLCLQRFLDEPDFQRINWKTEAIKDRVTNQKASWCEIPGYRSKIRYFTTRYI